MEGWREEGNTQSIRKVYCSVRRATSSVRSSESFSLPVCDMAMRLILALLENKPSPASVCRNNTQVFFWRLQCVSRLSVPLYLLFFTAIH